MCAFEGEVCGIRIFAWAILARDTVSCPQKKRLKSGNWYVKQHKLSNSLKDDNDDPI